MIIQHNKRIAIRILCVITMLETMGLFFIVPALPGLFLDENAIFLNSYPNFLSKEYKYAACAFLWAFGFFIGSTVIGILSDHIGQKRALIVCLIFSSMSYALIAFAIYIQNLLLVFLSRLTLGFFGSSYNIAQAYVVRISSDDDKMHNISLINLFMLLGLSIGPVISNMLRFLMPEVAESTVLSFVFAAVLLVICLLCSILFLTEDNINIESDSTSYFSLMTIFNNKSVLSLSFCYFLISLSFSTFQITMPIMFNVPLGYNTRLTDIIFVFLGCGYIVSISIQSKLLKIYSVFKVYYTSILIVAIVIITTQVTKNEFINCTLVFIYGVFETISYNCLILNLSNNVTVNDYGKATGGFGSIMCIALLCGSAIMPIISMFYLALPLVLSVAFFIRKH